MKGSVKGNLKKIAINGDGQLAMFIALAGKKFNFEFQFWSKNKLTSPCLKLGEIKETHSWDDLKSFDKLIRYCDYLILENEFIPAEFLKYAEEKGVHCIPNHASYSKLNSKVKQLHLIQKYDISTPIYKILSVNEHTYKNLAIKKKSIIKKSTHGYDGHGNMVVDVFTNPLEIKAFLNDCDEIIIQDFLEYDAEVAFVALVDDAHDTYFFPAVKTIQYNNICHFVLAPQIADPALLRLQDKIKILFKDIGATGLFGVELFKKDENYYFNEFAPRPHNSAHFSIDACTKSQFEIIMDLILHNPIEKIQMTSSFALMVNLLGNSDKNILTWKSHSPSNYGSHKIFTHLYNKYKSKPGRKMGHITLLGNNEHLLMQHGEWIKEHYEI